MKISNEHIEQLRQIIKDEKGIELSFNETESIGSNIINFIMLIFNDDEYEEEPTVQDN